MPLDYITKLLGIQGFVVKKVELTRTVVASVAILELERESKDYL